MRRRLIGIIAVLLLLGAAACWIWDPDSAFGKNVQAGCSRLGPLLAMLWIAYPDLKRMPGWLWPLLLTLAAVLAYKPSLFFVAVPLVAVLAIVKPRFGRPK